MNISIIGYGKMGKEVEKQSLKRGHSIYSVIEKDSLVKLTVTEVLESVIRQLST